MKPILMKEFLFPLILFWWLAFITIPVRAQCSCSDLQMLNMRKTALVVGEKSYKKGALTHTLNDAQDMRDSLRKVGFNVVPVLDKGKDSLENAISEWLDQLGGYQVALFYFSGHGSESALGNFLFPIDANPNTESELPTKCISANWILERMTKSSTLYNIVLLDACRDNPFTKAWSKGLAGGGLSAMSGTGAFVGFAALPGHTASDGKENDKHGIYTEAILRNITRANTTIYKIFTDINASVRETSDNLQTSYIEGTLSADFCFSPTPTKTTSRTPKTPSFVQPVSKLAISGDEQELFVIDNIDHEIIRLDANSFNRLTEKTIDYGAKAIACSTGNSVYVLDSTKNRLVVLNGVSLETAGEIGIIGKVRTFVINPDEKQAYIAYTDTSGNSYISEINLSSLVLSRTTKITCFPSALSLTSDHRYLYAIGGEKSAGNPLLQLDTKTFKAKEIKNTAYGASLGITPDNKKIYASCDTAQGTIQMSIIDQSTLKSINSLSLSPDIISFSLDKKYVFAASGQVIYIIQSDSDFIISNITLLNKPGGMVCTSDGRLIAWIPKEQRPAVFDLETQARRRTDQIQDPRLQTFNKKMNSSLKSLSSRAPIDLLRRIGDSIYHFSINFSKDLAGNYDAWGSGNGEYYSEFDSLAVSAGLMLRQDTHKRIFFTFGIKYDNGYIRIYYTDIVKGGVGQISYQFHAENFEYEKLKAETRELYLQRINTHLLLNDDSK